MNSYICKLSHHNPVATSAFVTGFISSAATAAITIIVCLFKQKRQWPKEPVTSTTSPGPVYDGVTEIRQRKEIFELASNAAYAPVKN